jgi:exosortase
MEKKVIVVIIRKYLIEILLIVLLAFMYQSYFPVWFSKWIDPESSYAFGFFMLAFIVYLTKENLTTIKEAQKKPSLYGIMLSLIGMILYILGIRTDIAYLVSMSLPVFIGGIVTGLYGIRVLKIILPSLILFAFTLPILPLHRITFPMQVLSAKLTVGFLNILGIQAYNEGTVINVFQYKLSVEAACSGLRSLLSLFFTSIIFSYFIQANKIKKFAFILISIPLALIMNICRLTLVSFYAVYNGYKGLQEFHDSLGFVLFLVSLFVMIFIAKLMENKGAEEADEI